MQEQSDPTITRIPARSRRRAMDWSLVLVSQGIEAVIDNHPETGWALLVATGEFERARAAIEQYRRENLHWPWRRPMLNTGVLFDWASIAWVLLTGIIFRVSENGSDLRDAGVMDSVAVSHGEWWRLFTAELLHADWLHFATNAVFGFLLLGLAMGRYGTGIGLFAAYLAGAGGNVASWLLYGQPHRGLGASGVVMGALGLLAAQSVGAFKRNPHAWRFIVGGLAGGIMLFVLLGTSPETDVVAHLGGFVTGIFLGAILSRFPTLAQRPRINLVAGLLFAVLVVGTWLLALRTLL